jgi:hypothetical protein
MEIEKNIQAFSEQELKRLKNTRKELEERDKNAPEPAPAPVDIYQRNQDRAYDVAQKSYPNGSSPAVNMSVTAVIDGAGAEGLAKAYKRAKDDSDSLLSRGEKGRAQIRRQQYMQEDFLPAVEIVVNSTSPDEVLNSKKALDELDKYTLLEGAGKGYTATYIRQAYGNQLGQQEGRSDASVRSDVMRLNALLDQGEIRSALGLANKLKEKIDKGEAMADDIDMDLIGRVVSFYSV